MSDLKYKETVTVEVAVTGERLRDHLRQVPCVDAVANIKACMAALHYGEMERTWEAVKDDPGLRGQFADIGDLFEVYADWFRKIVARDDI
jgi:hypothetical protein